VKITASSGGRPRDIILRSAYLPYYGVVPPNPEELERLVMGCRAQGTHLIIDCDANSQHTSWGSTNINNRGESLFNYIMANGVDISNRGNRHTLLRLSGRKLLTLRLPLFMLAIL
jgi:hypothetical protein